MLKTISLTIAWLAALALAALLIYAATRPDTFRVQRTLVIQAPAEKLFPLISDLRQFDRWNPFAKKDPAIRITYRGAASGPGAAYDFQGNKDVGRGSIEVTGVTPPTQVRMRLDMAEPFEGHNLIAFDLTPRGNTTEVSWAMHGPSPYISKLMGVVFNLDRMIGRDFEAGLADLKALAERP